MTLPGGVHGNLTSTARWLNTTNTYLTTSNVDDSYGRVTSTTDPKGNTTTYRYGSCYAGGGPTSVTNALNQTTSSCYDANSGLLTSTTDPNNQTTTFAYDDMFRTTLIRYPDGGQTTFVYPNAYQVNIRELMNSGGTYRDSWLQVDGFGREIRRAVVNGEATPWDQVDTCYNGRGQVSYKAYPYQGAGLGSVSYTCTQPGDTTTYDALDRKTSVTHSDGSSALTSYTSRATSVQDEGNGTQRVQRISQVDGLGRLASVCEVTSTTLTVGISGSTAPAACGQDIAATGFLTTYGYDVNSDLTSVAQGPLNGRSLVYDSLSRLTSSTNPESGGTSYTYDADGNVATRTDARGVTTTYSYDALNRLTEKSYSDGTTPYVVYGYDNAAPWGSAVTNYIGRRTSATVFPVGGGGSFSGQVYSYDPVGRIILDEVCTPLSCGNPSYPVNNLIYTYDFLGDMLSSTNGEGVTLSYAYNSGARLASITSSLSDSNHPSLLWGNPVHYDAKGDVTSAIFGNGIIETRSYDGQLRLASVTDGSIYTLTIPTYAPDGDILAANDNVNGNWTYAYDPFNRLISANATGQAYTYAYDRFGNRWQQNGPHVFDPPGFDANNRIVSGTGVSYDAAGDTTNDGSTAYTYDGEGRVKTASNGTSGTSTYVYDADGNRIQKTTAAGGTVYFLYDLAGHEITQISSTGAWSRGEVYAGGRHVATYTGTGGTTYFIHPDWLGTERVRSAVTGTSAETCTSLPYGDWLTCIGSDVSPMHLTGKEHDTETGLENFGARYDSSAMGRFMSPDVKPLQEKRFVDPQDLNLYLYTVDNPIRFYDPDGMDWQAAVQDLRQAIGELTVKAAVGFGYGGKGTYKGAQGEAEAALKSTLTVNKGKMSFSVTGDVGVSGKLPDTPKVGLSGEVDKVLGSIDTNTWKPGGPEPATASTTVGLKTTNYVLEGPDRGSVVGGSDKSTTVGGEGGVDLVAGGSASLTPAGVQDLKDAGREIINMFTIPANPAPPPPPPPPTQETLPGCHGSSFPNFCSN